MKDPLFESIQIDPLEVKNRIGLQAMDLDMTDNDKVTDQIVESYAERARGGVGMVTVGYTTVDDLSATPPPSAPVKRGGQRILENHHRRNDRSYWKRLWKIHPLGYAPGCKTRWRGVESGVQSL